MSFAKRRAAAAFALFAALSTAAPSGAATPAVDPWQALRELRRALAAAGELVGDFRQSYVPAGFTEAESERGEISLALPDCLRWDYLEPYPKSYLLCGSRLHVWTRGEPQGQRHFVDPEAQPGLDLLILPQPELEKRYRATVRQTAEGGLAIAFEPAGDQARLVEATVELDAARARPTALSYRDREGNRTRFDFGELRHFADATRFTAPPTIDWREP